MRTVVDLIIRTVVGLLVLALTLLFFVVCLYVIAWIGVEIFIAVVLATVVTIFCASLGGEILPSFRKKLLDKLFKR